MVIQPLNNATPLAVASTVIPPAVAGAAGVYKLQLAGQILVCRSSTAPVLAKMDGGAYFPLEGGFVIPGPDQGFTSITLQNNNAQPVVIVLYAGKSGVNLIPTNTQKVFSTYTKGTDLKGGTAIAAAGRVTFNGLDAGNAAAGPRKQITVQNMDAALNTIEVLDGNGVSMGVLPANSPPWTVETSGVVTVLAPAGASRVLVGEMFYTA